MKNMHVQKYFINLKMLKFLALHQFCIINIDEMFKVPKYTVVPL